MRPQLLAAGRAELAQGACGRLRVRIGGETGDDKLQRRQQVRLVVVQPVGEILVQGSATELENRKVDLAVPRATHPDQRQCRATEPPRADVSKRDAREDARGEEASELVISLGRRALGDARKRKQRGLELLRQRQLHRAIAITYAAIRVKQLRLREVEQAREHIRAQHVEAARFSRASAVSTHQVRNVSLRLSLR